MADRLKIAVLRDRYPMSFMTARNSRHEIIWRRFAPFSMLSSKFEGFTVLAPGLPVDLVHTNNRIPLGARKFILSFEDAAPRRFSSPQDNGLTRFLDARIASQRCRRLVAMSEFARRRFLHQHRDNPMLPQLEAKLMVRYPNLIVRSEGDALLGDPCDTLTLTFVGAHFARKGGCVAVKVAEKAARAGLPIRVNIVSSLQMGESVWTDPVREAFFDEYRALLTLDNVTLHSALPNAEVREMLRRSHFCILTTFADTFGYSAIEAMAEHTPVIGTRLCALPEIVEDGENGILIDMPLSPLGMWGRPDVPRSSPVFEEYFRSEVERIADATIERLAPLIGDTDRLFAMRRNARHTAETKFDARVASLFWDDLYSEVAPEDVSSRPLAAQPRAA